MDGFKLLEQIGLELDLPVISEWAHLVPFSLIAAVRGKDSGWRGTGWRGTGTFFALWRWLGGLQRAPRCLLLAGS
jgi:hypothetical protein